MTPTLPPGRLVELGDRGTTFAREIAGPGGDAPTLMLLHGLAATADLNWFRCYRALGERYRVVALDHRGHGRGIRLGGQRFRLADCADDVVALAEELGIDRFVAVGYSMGGAIAQLTAHRRPDRVAGLVLCATSARFVSSQRSTVAARTIAGAAGLARFAPLQMTRRLAAAMIPRRGDDASMQQWARSEIVRNDPAAVLQAALAIGRFDARPWLAQLDLPAAVVMTTRDRLVASARQQRTAAAIPGATLHACNADHGAAVTEPRVFLPVLFDALGSVTRRLSQPAA